MTEFPDPVAVDLVRDVLIVDNILSSYRVIIDGMALDDNVTYQRLVTELVSWARKT